jgi:hypothetical protein
MATTDFEAALAVRDAVKMLSRTVLDAERPSDRYGTVVTVDNTNAMAQVILNGDDTAIWVSLGGIAVLAGQTVRVSGARADKRISAVTGASLEGLTQRLQESLGLGGLITWTGTVGQPGNLKWSTNFATDTGFQPNAYMPEGYFAINMPAVGTVITKYIAGGTTTTTVTSSGITLTPYEALWYDLPYGQAHDFDPARLYIVNGWDSIPNLNAVRIAYYDAHNYANATLLLGTGEKMDFWRNITGLSSGWSDQTSGLSTPRYRWEMGHRVALDFCVQKSTAIANQEKLFNIPAPFRPTRTRMIPCNGGNSIGMSAMVSTSGDVTVQGYTASPNAAYYVNCVGSYALN